ncbi:MAG: serine/threonine-protein kinase [Nannocystaceae bacterium]
MPERPPSSSDEPTFGPLSSRELDEEATIDSAAEAWLASPPSASASGLSTGAGLGRYTILRRLGSGAMGVVYSAYDPELDRKVAIKILHPRTRAVADSEEGRRRLLREAKALARLSHPNVVTIHDAGTFGERVFLAMEFVDGKTLTAWLKAEKRSWREIVDVLRRAGEGLAAAHRGNLVHRDFKPDNVVIGNDGRVRVLDFGLARASDDIDDSSAPPEIQVDQSSSIKVGITTTGVLVGTPAYMSPEQHIGRPADSRSDQFAFCVTLYQALYGERPFAGENLSVLAANVIQGRIRPAPAGVKVPNWLRKVVLRGLLIDPDERFPTMEALLVRLRHDPVKIRTRWLALVAVLGVAVGAAIGAFGGKDPCSGAEDELAEIWSDARAQALTDAFRSTGVPYADTVAESTARALSKYAHDFAGARRDACMASRDRHEQSPELLDRRNLCLDGRRSDFKQLVQLLVDPEGVTASAVENAVAAVHGLPELESCADRAALLATVPLPEGENVVETVGTIRGEIAEAKALDVAGRWERGLEVAQRALAQAEHLEYAPVIAEALLVVSRLQQELGDIDGADASLVRAAEVAAEGRYDEAIALAWIDAIHVAGIRRSEFERALMAGDAARVAITRVLGKEERGERRSLLSARRELNLAQVYAWRRDPKEAQARAEEAHRAFQHELGDDHPLVYKTYTVLGLAALELREYATAKRHFDHALRIASTVSGREHPSFASVLVNSAQLLTAQRKYAEALVKAQDALRIREAALHPNHPDIARSLLAVAENEQALDRLDEAQEHYERALAIYEKDPKTNATNLAQCLNSLAMLEFARENYDAAERHFGRARGIFERVDGPEHSYTLTAGLSRGESLVRAGKIAAGVDQIEEIVALLRGRPDEAGLFAWGLLTLGEIYLERGDLSDAEAAFKESLATYAGIKKPEVSEVARARYGMAKTRVALGRDVGGAIALATGALQILDEDEPALRGAIEGWIAAQRR